MTYSNAKQKMREGHLVSRPHYAYDGIFFFIRPEVELHPLFIVTEVKSIPKAFKESLVGKTFTEGETIRFSEYICKREAKNLVTQGWQPSEADAVALDWAVYRPQL